MILVDYSQTMKAVVYADEDARSCAKNPCLQSEQLLTHYVLNTLRATFRMHTKKYGNMILAMDSYSWRYDVFPHYKHQRKVTRESDESGIDWAFVSSVSDNIIQAVKDYLPYPVVRYKGAEGDDVIGTLTKHISETALQETEDNLFDSVQAEPILIVSSDRDNFQLHSYPNVRQYCPREKKLISPDVKPQLALQEKILAGDRGDGIPGIICADDHFVNPPEKRVVLTAKRRAILESAIRDGSIKDMPEYTNFMRNTQLVDYSYTPKNISEGIISVYNAQKDKKANKMGFMNYLIANKMKNLTSQVTDFF